MVTEEIKRNFKVFEQNESESTNNQNLKNFAILRKATLRGKHAALNAYIKAERS